MAFESNYVTFIGNLTEDPELRFTGSGVPVCTIRLASNRRWKGNDGQENEETTYMNVNMWRDLASNVAETFSKGDRAIAIGRIKVRDYESDGVRKWVTEIEADEVAPSLRWAQATIRKPGMTGESTSPRTGSTPAPPPSDDDVPF